ncbi:MAG: TrmH family RNA methyltransferase [Clostridiales bacterium]|nr:TrmH family RNA methyltransferase [Clostridiales bacterium]
MGGGRIARYKSESSLSYALGAAVAIELLASRPGIVTRVFFHSACERGEGFGKARLLCEQNGIAAERNDRAFNVLSGKENCFVIAEFRKFREPLLPSPMHVVLVNPSDAGNLGTIMRTMAGFGLSDLAVVSPAADAFSPKAVRASMGAVCHVRCAYYGSFGEYAGQQPGRRLYPFMLGARRALGETAFAAPCAMVFGAESSGLPDEFMSVGEPVFIPCSKKIDSFSLPVAAAVAMHAYASAPGGVPPL